MIFVMNCGCRLEKKQLLMCKSYGYRCPNHPKQGVRYVEKACIDCDKLMHLNIRAITTLRCQECRIKHNKSLQKKADAKRRNPNSQKKDLANQEAAKERWDCAHRGECLSAISKDPHIKSLPCYDCERYASMAAA